MFPESIDRNLFNAAGKPDNWSSLDDLQKKIAAKDGLLAAGSSLKVRDIRAGAEFVVSEPEAIVVKQPAKKPVESKPASFPFKGAKKKATKKKKK